MSSSMSMSMSSMASMIVTATSAAASATSSAASSHDMGGMDMGDNACKINMLWNWYTIDACFLSSSWHIRSNGMFAASCIGIALLVVALEFCRRLGKEYDALIVRQFKRNLNARAAMVQIPSVDACEGSEPPFATFRASPLQQLVRSAIHAVVFGLAYLVMLLAMYYNGFVLISIVIGAGIGKFLCDWMIVKIPMFAQNHDTSGKNIDHQVEEPSVCCG
ncbi:hypothetical protein OHC33_000765 [Knufia fluminis]|uniref:Copper transport protein n=1 Tax=Knufia fluminis TaxID=191047 RepID=A0AAN8ERZ8_9EURO|nr:hypothetical protein OHC33_000765 [Knufia fluminis]